MGGLRWDKAGSARPTVHLTVFRDAVVNRKVPPKRPINSLMHVLVHGQDICRPLGIKRDLPEAHLVPVADFAKNDVRIFGTQKALPS